MNSIKFKIIFWFVLIGSLPAIGIGAYAIKQQSETLEQEAIQNQQKLLAQKLLEVNTFLQDIRFDLKEISRRFTLQNLIEAIPTQDQEEVEFWLEPVQEDFSRFAKIRQRYNVIQLARIDGQEMIHVNFDGKESKLLDSQDLPSINGQSFFETIRSLGEGQYAVLPLMAFDTKVSKENFRGPIIRFGMPLFTPGSQKVGVLVLTAFADHLLESFSDISNGSILLSDADGYLISHPDSQVRDNWVLHDKDEKLRHFIDQSLVSKIFKQESGLITDHSEEILSFQKVAFNPQDTSDFWIGILSQKREDVLLSIIQFRTRFIFIILTVVAIVVFAAMFFGNNLTRPLRKVVKLANSISDGELEVGRLNYTSKDEIGILAGTFDKMADTLRKNIFSIKDVAKTLFGSSTEISTAVQQQSAIMAQQSASITEITATLESLTTASSQIADNSNSVVQISAEALEQSKEGMNSILEINKKMAQIAEENENSVHEIVELGQKSKEIGRVMEIINDIADQTKLIAFNAAIEASSAGEAGKRFGVVAVEIRQLAENVMRATREIENKVEETQQAINRLVINSERGAKRVDEGAQLATETLAKLEKLVNGAQSTNEEADQISYSTKQQKNATSQVFVALKEIQQGIHETFSAIKQTSSITDNLANSSKMLNALVGEFKFNKKKNQ
jgi:methyl-accepting chemotaxis protein